MLVYDISRRATFRNCKTWLTEARACGNPQMVVILVGNKSDLEDERVENVVESAEALAAEYGMVGYVETSAKENVGVREAFELVARAVVFREEEDA